MEHGMTKISRFFSRRIDQYGATPLAAGWGNEHSQTLRFVNLCKVITHESDFSVNDLGCGYGALYQYLEYRYTAFAYTGFDVSENMVREARKRYPARFVVADRPDVVADYSMASGIFNIRLEKSQSAWHNHVIETLDSLHKTSRLGFAFNCLSAQSNPELVDSRLYSADPLTFLEICRKRYSKNATLLQDYNPYDFTVLVVNQ